MRLALACFVLVAFAPVSTAACPDCYGDTVRYLGAVNAETNDAAGSSYRVANNMTSTAYTTAIDAYGCQTSIGCHLSSANVLLQAELAHTNALVVAGLSSSNDLVGLTAAYARDVLP